MGRSKGADKISKSEAERLAADVLRPLNEARRQDRGKATFAEFVSDLYLIERRDKDIYDVRDGTVDNEEQRLKAYVLPEIGHIRFEDLEQDHLRNMLKSARRLCDEKGQPRLGEEMLRKLRFDITRICKTAVGKEYLNRPIWEGLAGPGSLKEKAPKRTVSWKDYRAGMAVLQERDRLAMDLVMFVGLRESEAFGLQIGDVREDRIEVRRSLYKGSVEEPKTEDSRRDVGVPKLILERLTAYAATLPARRPMDWLFPSTILVTPEWPENAMKNRIRPALDKAGYRWLNFAVLRRTFSTEHRKRNTDIDLIAHQQGHDKATHLRVYVQHDVDQLTKEVSRVYDEFISGVTEEGKSGQE